MVTREQHTWNAWGKRIAEARRRMGLTQAGLADLLNVAQSTVSKWENGTLAPDDASKFRLAETLDQSLEQLFSWPIFITPDHEKAAS
jgi:transcriptional regulator with XRE-family HTH domain